MKNENNIAYIDGANLHNGTVELGWNLDYRRFRVWLSDKYMISDAKIFIGKVSKFTNIYEKFDDAGFQVHFKETIQTSDGRVKGNCDTELAVEAISDFYEGRSSKAVIITSDGDFSCVVKFLKDKDSFQSVVSPRNTASLLLKRLGVPVVYLDTKRRDLQYSCYTSPI